ncbi:MAG TPA: glycosyltransferase [Rhodoferax sp.]|nr:glycosyltransferase [Rhodoferax sp.]
MVIDQRAAENLMNIVHVVENLAIGGLERLVVSLAAWQRQRGHMVHIICLFDAGGLAEQAREAGIAVTAINKQLGWDLPALRVLRATLRKYAFEVLHTHNALAHYYAAAGALGLGIGRILNTRHGMGAAPGGRRERLYRLTVRVADAVVFVSRAGHAHFVHTTYAVPKSKAHVIPNGVEVAAIAERRDEVKQNLLAELGRPPETLLIGSVGRLSPVKDHATLLLALQRLRQTGITADLVLVGDGIARTSLEAQARELGIADNVHFLGMRNDVHSLLPAFDVFAQTSITEGYSLALVEAATAALPIVATCVGGNADIVISGVNGLLVDPKNYGALSHALIHLLGDRSLRLRMGQAGRKWALTFGSLEAMGVAYESLYQRDPVGSGGGP